MIRVRINQKLINGKSVRYLGSRGIVIQDIHFKTDNIQFLLERYEVDGKTIESKLPPEYRLGEFGPGIYSLIMMLTYEARVTQRKIHAVLTGVGVKISLAQIARIANYLPESMIEEQKKTKDVAILKAGHLQVDDTGAKIYNRQAYTFVMCNQYFCDYFTTFSKSRLGFLDALNQYRDPLERSYVVNATSLKLLKKASFPAAFFKELKRFGKPDKEYSAQEFEQKWLLRFRYDGLGKRQEDDLKTACLIAAYRRRHSSVRCILVSDDALNFKQVFRQHALCWVHEIRRYRAIFTFGEYYRQVLDSFLSQLVKFYKKIKAYCKAALRAPPDLAIREALIKEFDTLFSTPTEFEAINEMLLLTLKRRKGLLLPLYHPNTPLHNNTSELDARERVMKRKISISNQSQAGVIAWDTYMSLAHTCRKNSIPFWAFLKDRFHQTYTIPPLHRVIQKAS